MLVLQRKVGQALFIGEDIKVTIQEIGADKVKISIEAPKEISILREELVDAVQNNKEAAETSATSLSSLKNFLIKK